MQHLTRRTARTRPAAMAAHPASRGASTRPAGSRSTATVVPLRHLPDAPDPRRATPEGWEDEEGSLVTEYGLLAVVAATVAGVVIQWASGGALVSLFNALLRHARSLVGA